MKHSEAYITYLQNCIQFLLENLKNRSMRKILKHYKTILESHPINEPLNQPLIADYILNSMVLLQKESIKK